MNIHAQVRTGALYAGIVLGVLGAASPAAAADGGKGSGNVVTQRRPVAAFTAIRLDSIGSLVVEQTGADSLEVTVDDNLQSNVTSEVRDGTLVLAEHGCQNCSPTKIAFRITVRSLKEIALHSTGSAEVSKLDAPAFSAALSGTGRLKLSGKVDELKISATGTGSCDAAGLTAQRASVMVGGVARVRVNAVARLDANVSGVGKLEYLGNPAVTKSTSGRGSIKQVNQ